MGGLKALVLGALMLWLGTRAAWAAPTGALQVDTVPVKLGQLWQRVASWPDQPDRPPGEWTRVGDHTPVTLEVSRDYFYDLAFVGPSTYPFVRWTGQRTHVMAGQGVTIQLSLSPAWDQVLGTLALSLGLVGWGVQSRRRRLEERARQLETAYQASEARVRTLEAHGGDPTRLGGYHIKGRLGQGGMARVYRVEDQHGDTYALKIPSGDLTRFEREWKILSSFHHPGIVRVFDYQPATEEHPAFLVMELIDGETLGTRLRTRGRLSVKEAVQAARNLLSILEYTHSRGIVHRDLSPNNIFLLYGGGLKVVDFGISKDFSTPLTHTGEMLGTPAYAAPEQIESQSATERTDLYTVGVVLYEMLTGQIPFDTSDALKLFRQKAQGVKTPPRALNPAVDEALSGVVMRLLESDPAHRPASAREALELLP